MKQVQRAVKPLGQVTWASDIPHPREPLWHCNVQRSRVPSLTTGLRGPSQTLSPHSWMAPPPLSFSLTLAAAFLVSPHQHMDMPWALSALAPSL